MSTPESKVKSAVIKILKAHNVYYFFPATHGYGRSGVPDIVACVRGRFIAIECKAGKNELTALQQREIKSIQIAGGIAMVVREDSVYLVDTIIKELKDE
jgi:Holliday junction resolvase